MPEVLPLPLWALWLQALGLPILGATIAFAGVCIARQQKKLADVSLQNALYDRRYKIYEATRSFLVSLQRNGLQLQNYFEFVAATHEAVFLFKAEVVDYLALLRDQAAKLHIIVERLKDKNLSQDRRAASADEAAELGKMVQRSI